MKYKQNTIKFALIGIASVLVGLNINLHADEDIELIRQGIIEREEAIFNEIADSFASSRRARRDIPFTALRGLHEGTIFEAYLPLSIMSRQELRSVLKRTAKGPTEIGKIPPEIVEAYLSDSKGSRDEFNTAFNEIVNTNYFKNSLELYESLSVGSRFAHRDESQYKTHIESYHVDIGSTQMPNSIGYVAVIAQDENLGTDYLRVPAIMPQIVFEKEDTEWLQSRILNALNDPRTYLVIQLYGENVSSMNESEKEEKRNSIKDLLIEAWSYSGSPHGFDREQVVIRPIVEMFVEHKIPLYKETLINYMSGKLDPDVMRMFASADDLIPAAKNEESIMQRIKINTIYTFPSGYFIHRGTSAICTQDETHHCKRFFVQGHGIERSFDAEDEGF